MTFIRKFKKYKLEANALYWYIGDNCIFTFDIDIQKEWFHFSFVVLGFVFIDIEIEPKNAHDEWEKKWESVNGFIKSLYPPEITVISPEGHEFTLNEYEWMHLRTKIYQNKSTGWAFKNKTGKIGVIDTDGRMEDYPDEFSVIDRYTEQLLDPRFNG